MSNVELIAAAHIKLSKLCKHYFPSDYYGFDTPTWGLNDNVLATMFFENVRYILTAFLEGRPYRFKETSNPESNYWTNGNVINDLKSCARLPVAMSSDFMIDVEFSYKRIPSDEGDITAKYLLSGKICGELFFTRAVYAPRLYISNFVQESDFEQRPSVNEWSNVEFTAWIKRCGHSSEEAARLFDISLATVKNYRARDILPRRFTLAALLFEDFYIKNVLKGKSKPEPVYLTVFASGL